MHKDDKSVLCYVAGATVHNLVQQLNNSLSHKMLSDTFGCRVEYKKRQLMEKYYILHITLKTDDRDSLLELVWRESDKGGLLYVTDEAFSFFKLLFIKMISIQT